MKVGDYSLNAFEFIKTQHKNDKAQRDFVAHCQCCLWNYAEIRSQALNAAEKAVRACADTHKQSNAAVRAFNCVLFDALKLIEAQDWKQDKPERREIKQKPNYQSKPADKSMVGYQKKNAGSGMLDKMIGERLEARK